MFPGGGQDSCQAVTHVGRVLPQGTEDLRTRRRSVLKCECGVWLRVEKPPNFILSFLIHFYLFKVLFSTNYYNEAPWGRQKKKNKVALPTVARPYLTSPRLVSLITGGTFRSPSRISTAKSWWLNTFYHLLAFPLLHARRVTLVSLHTCHATRASLRVLTFHGWKQRPRLSLGRWLSIACWSLRPPVERMSASTVPSAERGQARSRPLISMSVFLLL